MIDTLRRDGSPGERLAAYLEGRLAPGQSMRAFCRDHGLDNALVSAWKSGRGVDLDSARRVADALGLTLGQVLVVAGYGEPSDFGGAVPPEPVAPIVDVDYAIEHDPNLTDAERALLRQVRQFTRGNSPEIDTMTVQRKVTKPRGGAAGSSARRGSKRG